MKPKILITAANGNTGFPAVKELLELGFPVRAFVRNPDNPKARELKALGAELFVGDIEDIRDVRKALTGVKRAYFAPVPPNVLFQGSTFATAAEEMGLEHVVVMTQWLSSNTHPSMFTKEHWLVDQTFKRLENVGVTFVNPGLFAMAYLMNLEAVSQFGMFPEFACHGRRTRLQRGDLLTVFSDGVTEATLYGDEFFERESAEEVVLRNSEAELPELMDLMFAEINAFLKGGHGSDDTTLLMLRRRA